LVRRSTSDESQYEARIAGFCFWCGGHLMDILCPPI
jgi:hypothetical protein